MYLDGLVIRTHPDVKLIQFDEPLSGRISRLFADSRAGSTLHQLNNSRVEGTIEKTLH